MIRYVFVLAIILLSYNIVFSDTHISDNCTLTAVNSAIILSSNGDTVTIRDGNCTWGDSASHIVVDKAITLRGESHNGVVITLSDTGGTYDDGIISISDNATISDFIIYGSNANPVSAFRMSSANKWRITNITYIGGTSGAWFSYADGVYGLIDNCTITGNSGTAELIWSRGPTDSWQTDSSMGLSNNLFVENCIFNNEGYVSDINANGRAVFRYNTINGSMKIDGHGVASNTPARSVRHMEIYNNNWTSDGFWTAIEIRGGTGRVYNNVIDGSKPWVMLTDYAYRTSTSNFGDVCMCPSDYPVTDQIGVGKDPKSSGSEPLYLWNNIKNGSIMTSGDLEWQSTSAPVDCAAYCGAFTMDQVIKENTDFFISETKPAALSAYTPYTCPHPLTGLTGSCNSSIAGTAGYNVNSALKGRFTGSGALNMR